MKKHGDCCSNSYCSHRRVGLSTKKKVSTNYFASSVGIENFDPRVESSIEKMVLKTHYSDPYLPQLLPKFGIACLLLWCQPTFLGHSWWIGRARCQSLFAYQWFPVQAFRCRSLFLPKFTRAHLNGLATASFRLETLPSCHVKIICSLVSTCDSWYCYLAFRLDLLTLFCLQLVDIALNYFSIMHLLINYFHDLTTP